MGREDQADNGRRPGATSKTRAEKSMPYEPPQLTYSDPDLTVPCDKTKT